MSAAIAVAPAPAPHDRSSYADVAPHAPSSPLTASNTAEPPRPSSTSPKSTPVGKSSPSTARNAIPPKIIVKKEPLSSPDLPLQSARHRPPVLDLSTNTSAARTPSGALTARPLETAGLGIQDVGLACLSPGFMTQDPTMREQLQRSISVREQQRHLIERRLQLNAKPGDTPIEGPREPNFPPKTPGTSRRKAPPGLSIVAPSHEQFAHERVIQSAPLNQTFTGRHQPHPLTRHVANQPSNLSNTSHIHHVPANQTMNRLPPIADVFEGISSHRDGRPAQPAHASHPSARPALPSPGRGAGGRPREYRSAEDAQVELAGGRPELLPKLVHYGGHQPPTPPSPQTSSMARGDSNRGGKRRNRAEYEDGASPPLGHGPTASRRGPFGEGRDSPGSQLRKKEEFMRLCDRAWDLFHS